MWYGALVSALVGAATVDERATTLASLRGAVARIRRYDATLDLDESTPERHEASEFAIRFTMPSELSVRIVRASQSQGATATWQGGTTVEVQPPGLLRVFHVRLAIDDPRVLSLLGERVTEMTFPGIVDHMEATPGGLRESDGPTIDGVATKSIDLDVADPATDRGFTTERLYVDRSTMLPVRFLGYVGQRLARVGDFHHVRVDLGDGGSVAYR